MTFDLLDKVLIYSQKKLKNAKLIIIPDSGHSMSEKGITKELIKATNNL